MIFGSRDDGSAGGHGYRHLLVKSFQGVQTITMNRPEKRNALCPLLMEELVTALDQAAECECGVVVLTGAGSAFCAGLDMDNLATMHAQTREEARKDSERMAGLLLAIYRFPKPILAAVNGPAIAGGMALATLCDFTYATPDSRFAYTEVRLGYIPAIVATFLMRQMGEKRTRELLLSGRILKAEEAQRMGLVTRVVPTNELHAEVTALAQTLRMNSPQAMTTVKQLLTRHDAERLEAEIEAAIEANAEQHSSEDFREGVRAFFEHRKADWPSRRAAV